MSFKVYLDEATWADFSADYSTAVNNLTAVINEKYGGEYSLKRSLYITLDVSKTPLNCKLLRQLKNSEKIFRIDFILNQKRRPHNFYALFPSSVNPFNDPKVAHKKTMKAGNLFVKEIEKWELMGDLLKTTQKKGKANQIRAFSKRTFYLGRDLLCYRSEKSIFSKE